MSEDELQLLDSRWTPSDMEARTEKSASKLGATVRIVKVLMNAFGCLNFSDCRDLRTLGTRKVALCHSPCASSSLTLLPSIKSATLYFVDLQILISTCIRNQLRNNASFDSRICELSPFALALDSRRRSWFRLHFPPYQSGL